MSAFTELKKWSERIDGIDYVTTKEIVWEVGALGSGHFIRVPVGFRFQASIPWIVRLWISPHDDRIKKVSALHDYALHVLGWSRTAAAAPFSEGLRALGVSRLKRKAMVLAVIFWRFE
jgi:hypothetical protein